MPTLLSIADETDLIVTIPRDTLVVALTIAATQLDVRDDDEATYYGHPNVAAALADRERIEALNAVNEAV